MKAIEEQLEEIEQRVELWSDQLNELITETQALEPKVRDKRQAQRRHRLEIELLNIRDMIGATRG